MQLTRFSDYALRVLIHLASRPERRTTIREVSEAHGISQHHLMKVVHRLSTLGYLKASRGRGGGIEAAGLPAQISVGKVIRDLEPLAAVECCVPGYQGSCILFPACALRGALQAAQAQFLKSLDACTLAQLARPGLARAIEGRAAKSGASRGKARARSKRRSTPQ